MADNIGEASVKITADITPLQQAVAKAKQSLEPLKNDTQLGNFTVNWDGGSGSIEEYNAYLKKANEEWEEYERQQLRAKQAADELAASTAHVSEKIVEQAQTIEATSSKSFSLSGMLESMKWKAVEFGDAAYGNFMRVTDSVRELDRVNRTALIAISAAITMFGKQSLQEYAKYDKTFSNTMKSMEKSVSQIKAAFGSALAPLAQLASGILEFAADNKQLVSGIITAIGVISGGAGLTAAVIKLGSAFRSLGVFAKSALGAVGLIVGIAAYLITDTQDFSTTLDEASDAAERHADATKSMESAYKDYQGALSDVGEEIAEIRKQMQEAEREYRQSLKNILVTHEDTVKNLTEQIKESNKDYQRAVEERNAAFATSQAVEERKHQEKVDELMAQMNFLQRYNNEYNRQKLEQVRFALAKENRLHQEQTAAQQAELDLQNQVAKEKHEARLEEYQAELDKELEFLRKHRVLLDGVRGEILDDEIESLTRQYEAQVASYNKQIENAGKKGAEAAQRWSDSYAEYLNETKSINDAAANSANKFSNSFIENVNKNLTKKSGFFAGLDQRFYNLFSGLGFSNEEFSWVNGKAVSTGRRVGWSTGGYTGSGDPNDIAGVVHKNEYVLPAHMVDQKTGTPKKMGDNITINVNGVFATSASERRRVADQIVAALQQTNQARLGA